MQLYEELGLPSKEEMYRRVIYILAKNQGGALGVTFDAIKNLPPDAYLVDFVDYEHQGVGFEMWPKPEGDPDRVIATEGEEFRQRMLADRAAQVERKKSQHPEESVEAEEATGLQALGIVLAICLFVLGLMTSVYKWGAEGFAFFWIIFILILVVAICWPQRKI